MKKAAIALILVLASVALVACGSSGGSAGETGAESPPANESGGGSAGSGAGSAGGEAIGFEADPNGELAYTTGEVTAKAGEVTIDFNNPQPLPHDVAIENASGELIGQTEQIAEGEDSTVVDLKPGTYKFFCTVPGHRQAGMEGTLVVK